MKVLTVLIRSVAAVGLCLCGDMLEQVGDDAAVTGVILIFSRSSYISDTEVLLSREQCQPNAFFYWT